MKSYTWFRYGVEAVFVVAIFFYGWTHRRRHQAADEASA
jgi:hypothetical protein